MKKILVNSFAKINISLDILGTRPDGYHEVETFMQTIDLADDVLVRYYPLKKNGEETIASSGAFIELGTNRVYLPTDSRNLAYKAAELMVENFGAEHSGGKLRIDIKKRIPVAAGLAGGSGNAAAVLHAVNRLWNLKLTVGQLCDLGKALGADVPFCVMSVAATNLCLGADINKDPLAMTAAIGRGTGAELEPASPLEKYVVISKPKISISTKEVYAGIDEEIKKAAEEGVHIHHARADVIEQAVRTGDEALLVNEMGNILELYSVKRYPQVANTKSMLRGIGNPIKVMMSGSGPTVFALYRDKSAAKEAAHILKQKNRATFAIRTI